MGVTQKRVAVLVSGNGSNLQALLDGAGGAVEYRPGPLEQTGGLCPATGGHGPVFPTAVVRYEDFPDRAAFTRGIILDAMQEPTIDLICLAGFNRILDRVVIEAFPLRMMNTHPALLPAFGG